MNDASSCRSTRKLSSSSWSSVTRARIVGSPLRGDSAYVPELASESWGGASANLDSIASTSLLSGRGRIGRSEQDAPVDHPAPPVFSSDDDDCVGLFQYTYAPFERIRVGNLTVEGCVKGGRARVVAAGGSNASVMAEWGGTCGSLALYVSPAGIR